MMPGNGRLRRVREWAHGLRPRSSADAPIAMLRAYFDESHEGKAEHIFAIGGILGTPEVLEEAERQWIDLIGEQPFHAADLESQREQYQGWSKEQSTALFRSVVDVLDRVPVQMYGVCVRPSLFYQAFPQGTPEDLYYLSFQICAGTMAGLAHARGETISLVFDLNPRTEHQSLAAFRRLKVHSQEFWPEALVEAIFADDKRTPCLQMADLVVREMMKDALNTYTGSKRPRRIPMQRLAATGRLVLQEMGESQLERLRAEMAHLDAAQRRAVSSSGHEAQDDG